MSDVLFDYSRVLSALRNEPDSETFRPHLFLWNLAKLTEAVVLYDSILLTEPIDHFYLGWKKERKGVFDFTKPLYEGLIGDVLREYPHRRVDEQIAPLRDRLEDTRVLHPGSGLYFYAADIASLREVLGVVRMSDFQFLTEGFAGDVDEEAKVLMSMDRVRTLLTVGGVLGATYDPISFREPLVRFLSPGNVGPVQLHSFRKFERDVYEYISEVVGGSLALRLPLLFNTVIRECANGSPDDVIKVALQLRKDPQVVALRHVFSQFVNSYAEVDVAKMARATRILQEELERLKKTLRGESVSKVDIKLKLGWLPLDLTLDIQSLVQRLRDREVYPALSNLATLTRQTFLPLMNVREKIRKVLGIDISDSDLNKLPLMTGLGEGNI